MRTRAAILFTVVVGTLVSLAGSAVAQEGYDPLRQITQQIDKANLYVVEDVTGSMAGDVNGTSVTGDDDATGRLLWDSGKGSGTSSGSGSSKKWQIWTYKLTYELPSRMATVKNALGNSVSLVTSFTPAANYGSLAYWTALGRTLNPSWTGTVSWPPGSSTGPWTFKVTFPAASPASRPGIPVHAYCADGFPGAPDCTSADFPTSGSPATIVIPLCVTSSTDEACTPTEGYPLTNSGEFTFSPPADVIGTNKNQVNWGLIIFSTNNVQSGLTTCTGGQLLKEIDTKDSSDVSVIEGYLRLTQATWPASHGLFQTGGSTNTIGALTFAQDVISKTFAGTGAGTITVTTLDGAGTVTTKGVKLLPDPKRACDRPYGVVLATDGQSNQCNPSNAAWPSSCPSTAAKYAAQQAHNIWNLSLDPSSTTPSLTGPIVNPRTWVIGVSTDVGECELDFIAYSGRTDANSFNKDAGYRYQKDRTGTSPTYTYYLPQVDAPGNISDPTTGNSYYDGPNGAGNCFRSTGVTWAKPPAHGHYAFFATTSSAIADAFSLIVNSTGVGDYATSSPTSGGSISDATKVFLASAGFPDWKGHFTAFDTTKLPTDVGYRVWDAGAQLNTSVGRKIYTWDSSNSLVEIIPTKQSPLDGISVANGGASGAFSLAVIDFVRGNNGTGTARSWILGPIINSTPAVTGPPVIYHQGLTKDHSSFESNYSTRGPLLWVGSDDGMMHAFRYETGVEELAILPPDLLPRQIDLYNNSKGSGTVTGQPVRVNQHLYGVASSLRFQDVWFRGDTPPGYRTVGILSEGPGGRTIAALDITHPYGGDPASIKYKNADPNYDVTKPVTVLWSFKGGASSNPPDLFPTWSVPALAATGSTVSGASADTWTVIFGSGQNPASKLGSSVDAHVYTMDLSTSFAASNLKVGTLLSRAGSPAAFVGQQAFADSVLFSTLAPGFFSDNIANLGLQSDLNGQIWFSAGSTGTKLADAVPSVFIDATLRVGSSQPLYYPAAVSGFGKAATGCDLFAFGSGSFYETSDQVTGTDIGASPKFIPSFFTAVNPKPAAGALPAKPDSSLTSTQVYSQPIAGTYSTGDPSNPTITLTSHTQMTSAPFIIAPLSGTGRAQALFLVYDPANTKNGCKGESFVISLTFNIDTTTPLTCTKIVPADPTGKDSNRVISTAYDAGAGAASGFAVSGTKVMVSMSGVGEGAQSGLYTVPNVQLQTGSSVLPQPIWWKELK